MSHRIKAFFDRIAPRYKEKFTSRSPFLRYFFEQRLDIALSDFNFEDQLIFDVGAGTGILYDKIKGTNANFQYYGCDLSEKMLAQSNIPEKFKLIGHFNNVNWPNKTAQFIFALGLSSYLEKEEWEALLTFIKKHLSKDGYAIISFTNKSAFELGLRRTLKQFLKQLPTLNKHVIGLPFFVKAYTPQMLKLSLSQNSLYLDRVSYLCPSLPFLQHIFAKFAVIFSQRLCRFGKYRFFRERLSTEFVVFFRLDQTK